MRKLILLLCLFIYSSPLLAKNIEIDADEKVEWYRNEQKIIAIGNAVAVKENNTLKGDKLTVIYERIQLEDGSQKNQIQKIFSDGKVRIEMPNSFGTGDNFVYDVPLDKAILTGKPALLKNQQGEITAEDSIIYYGAENKSVAQENVIAQNPDYTVYADKMVSFFDTDKQGKKRLNRVEIYAENKPVKIVNKQSTVTGKRGTYFPLENKLKMFDNVVINQNNDILNGDYAETDLKTGISRLLATKSQNSRVTGVFRNKK